MKRVLSGIQPSGQLHLGNYAGAIRQFVEMQHDHEMFIFVASYHALTSLRDPEALRIHTRQAVIDHIAFGLDPELPHVALYRQQDVPQVTELAWLLSCVSPKSFMDKQVAFKEKVDKGLQATIGLYTYPILQAADILIVSPDLVPVGADQKQNLEITRDLAQRFNQAFGETFKLPQAQFRAEAGTLPGIDGQKMSKSYGNTIDPFLPEKKLRKTVMKIVTDSKEVEQSKDPDTCTVYQIFRAIAGEQDQRTQALAEQYCAGGMGYGHAKQALFELILEHFAVARTRREELMQDPGYIDAVLQRGAERAHAQILPIMQRVRQACGL